MSTAATTAARLSVVAGALALASAAAGLVAPGLYRDNALVTAGWYGNDLVTALLAVPALLAALLLAARGSVRAQLVWLGLLDYVLYNYAFYLFGSAFNSLFLAYVALVSLSILALIWGSVSLDVARVRYAFRDRTPARGISIYMLLLALALGGVHVAQALAFALTGAVPPVVRSTGHPTNVVAALDLSLVVSFLVVGATLLWRRHPWGYIVATVVNVKGAVYMAALTAASAAGIRAGFADLAAQIPLWAGIGVTSLIASVVLLVNVDPGR